MTNRFGNYVSAAGAAFMQSPHRPWVVGGGTTQVSPFGRDDYGGTSLSGGGTGVISISPHVCNGGGITTT